jgi:hypothetical protein
LHRAGRAAAAGDLDPNRQSHRRPSRAAAIGC